MRIKLNKYSFLTIVGAVLPTASYAQTFYQCMPLTCSNGQYISGNECATCTAGTYQSGNERATACSKCADGKYSDAGASSCYSCPAGSYCKDGIKKACVAGKYSEESSSVESHCKSCPKGHYCPGGTDKQYCSPGYYNVWTGQSACKTCSGYNNYWNSGDPDKPIQGKWVNVADPSASNHYSIVKYECYAETGKGALRIYDCQYCVKENKQDGCENKKKEYQNGWLTQPSMYHYSGSTFVCPGGCTIQRID